MLYYILLLICKYLNILLIPNSLESGHLTIIWPHKGLKFFCMYIHIYFCEEELFLRTTMLYMLYHFEIILLQNGFNVS